MATILLTGFEPFGGDDGNPSGDAVREIARTWNGPATLVTAILPVEFGRAAELLRERIREMRPDVVIATGLAGGRRVVTPERVAINLRDARIPDNAGAWPVDKPSVTGGPAAYFSTLPVKRIAANAVRMRGNVSGCIVHSDRGSHFRSRKLHRELAANNLVGSMGRVASCGDNAAMESFFSLLQKNVLNRRSWATREELRIAIVTWIERTYHRCRRQARLGRLTPVEFETIMSKELALAA